MRGRAAFGLSIAATAIAVAFATFLNYWKLLGFRY
jgi:hypothetical protein